MGEITIEAGPMNATTDPTTGLRAWYNGAAGTSSAITNTSTIADGRRGASPTSAAVRMSGGTSSMDKVCTKCGIAKPIGGFHSDRQRRDGRRSICKTCSNSRWREVQALRASGEWSGREYVRTDPAERVREGTVIGPDVGIGLGACWLWTGSVGSRGYGQINIRALLRPVGTHRVAYEAVNGPIPDGMELDHLCEVKTCVRPDHLDVVTKAEHSRRSCARLDAKSPGWRLGA